MIYNYLCRESDYIYGNIVQGADQAGCTRIFIRCEDVPAFHFIGWPIVVTPGHLGGAENEAEDEAEEYREEYSE